MENLTEQQSRILAFIVDFYEENKRTPHLNEIKVKNGNNVWISPQGVKGHLQRLIAKGYIKHNLYERKFKIIKT